MWEKHCPVILPLFLQVILLCFCLFHFVAFLAVTLFGGLGKKKIKNAIFPDSQSFIYIKSNTLKHYAKARILEIVPNFRNKKTLVITWFSKQTFFLTNSRLKEWSWLLFCSLEIKHVCYGNNSLYYS